MSLGPSLFGDLGEPPQSVVFKTGGPAQFIGFGDAAAGFVSGNRQPVHQHEMEEQIEGLPDGNCGSNVLNSVRDPSPPPSFAVHLLDGTFGRDSIRHAVE